MHFTLQTLGAVAFAVLATAQSTVLSFDTVPNPITDGKATAITYHTNDTSSPVTIILRKGPSANLQTVETLTTSATDGQYIWTPSTSLADGTDYALEITQESQINYFGPFTIKGASASASSSASSSLSAYGSTVVSSSVTATVSGSTITSAVNVTNPAPTSTAISGSAINTANATITALTAASLNATGTIGTIGTGIPMSRNTTMSKATLSTKSASTHAIVPATGTAGSISGLATSTSSSTAGAQASSGASPTNQASSTIALFVGAMAAILYLQ